MLCHQKPGAWVTKGGSPCRQVVREDPTVIGCVHHSGDPERVKKMQQKGGLVSQHAIRVKKGAIADSEPDLVLGTVEQIDGEIIKALEQLRRGKLGERKAELLVTTLQKLRTARLEAEGAAPRPAPQVVLGWATPRERFCDRCSCPACTKNRTAHQRMLEWNPHLEGDGISLAAGSPRIRPRSCPARMCNQHEVMPRDADWRPPSQRTVTLLCEHCDEQLDVGEHDTDIQITLGAVDETPEEASARWRR